MDVNNNLVLLKLDRPAPAAWKPVTLALQLVPTKEEQDAARAKDSPLYPDGIGLPIATAFGYGDKTPEGEFKNEEKLYGMSRQTNVEIKSEVRPWAPGFLAEPVRKTSGLCSGDAGGAAMISMVDPKISGGTINLQIGVLSAFEKPCVGNKNVYMNVQYFAPFITKASK